MTAVSRLENLAVEQRITQAESPGLQACLQSALHTARQPQAARSAAAGADRYEIGFAHTAAEVREAQRLRYQVFAEEMGANLSSRTPGIDEDIFDSYCDHLIVRDRASGQVVGTYRILPPDQAKRIGCYYSESEFFINRLQDLRPRMVELGRSCVHAEHRSGAVIMLLWSGIAHYMIERGFTHLIGCASVSMRDGGIQAVSLYHKYRDRHVAAPERQVFPKHALPFERITPCADVEEPPLVKGYLRVGAHICGEPAWDPDFNTADFLMLMAIADVNPRYARHFGLKPTVGEG